MRLSFPISEPKKIPLIYHLHLWSIIIITITRTIITGIVTSALHPGTCLTISVSVSDRSRLTAESGILTSPRRP